MKKTLLALLLTALARAEEPFLQALPELRRLLYQDPTAFAKAFQAWEAQLPDWTPGPTKAAILALRADFRSRQRDRPGQIANLVAALDEPGLDPVWKYRTRLELANAYLYQKNQPAYQQVLLEAVREGPARLNPGEIEQLLSLKNEEASQRGDLAFNFIYRQLTAQQQPLRLADWYGEHGRPDAQLEWWLVARDALQSDPKKATSYQQWATLWRSAPPAQKAWALQQQLQALQALTPLEQARARVAIASAMQGQQSPPADATPAALLSQPNPLALLHIATHTLARPDDPLQSSVQLHGGNLLLTQLHQLKLRKDALVVLSSCRGALPLNPGQAQPISLASALSAAGAQTVIANLWDADDQAATLFFDHFYRRLAQHKQVGRAFHEAQQALRKAHPDPYYWAGFCLLGNPPN